MTPTPACHPATDIDRTCFVCGSFGARHIHQKEAQGKYGELVITPIALCNACASKEGCQSPLPPFSAQAKI